MLEVVFLFLRVIIFLEICRFRLSQVLGVFHWYRVVALSGAAALFDFFNR